MRSREEKFEMFMEDGREALRNFVIMEDSEISNGYIHAEADTGTRYEVYAVKARGENFTRNESSYKIVSIYEPRTYTGVYPIMVGGLIEHNYFLEKFGGRGNDVSSYHGGDVYALIMCICLLTGCNMLPLK